MLNKIKVYDLVIISLFSAILFIQEQIFAGLPNIQLTFFLVILYSKKLPLIHAILIVIIHVLLDSLFTSSFTLIYTPAMLIGYFLIPITIKTIFKKVNSNTGLAFLSILYAMIYSSLFAVSFVVILKVDLIAYFIADIPFVALLAASSFITTLLLYDPLKNILDHKLKL